MDDVISKDARIRMLVAAALEGSLTDAQAEELARLDRNLIKLAFLAAAQRIAELQGKLTLAGPDSPSTPSGQRPIYTKPSAAQARRPKKPGAKAGHAGSRRPTPERIDRREEHRLAVCRIARDMGCPRGTVRRLVGQIRRRFESIGLDGWVR